MVCIPSPNAAYHSANLLLTQLFCKESAAVRGIRRTIGHSREEIFYILRRILFCILKVIINYIVGIQAELCCLFRLLCIVQYKELIRLILLCNVHAVRRKRVLDPELGRIGVLTSLKDSGCTDLEAGSRRRNYQFDIVVA